VIGREVVALDGANPGPAGIADAVANEAQMVGAAAEKAIAGLTSAVQMEPAELQVGRIRRKAAAVHIKHRRRVCTTGPGEFYRRVAKGR